MLQKREIETPADPEMIFIACKLLFLSLAQNCCKFFSLMKIFVDTVYADHGTDCIAIAH